jgi:hypothetical protein
LAPRSPSGTWYTRQTPCAVEYADGRRPQRQGRLERENARLKALVGELALEFKKRRGGARLMRGRYAKVAARNAALLERIRALKAEHPLWGYVGSGRICATSTPWWTTRTRLQRDEGG